MYPTGVSDQTSDVAVLFWLSRVSRYGPASGHATLSASDLQEQYGEALHAESRDAPTAYKLRKALASRDPPIFVTEAALKVWLAKYFVADSHVKVVSAARHRHVQIVFDLSSAMRFVTYGLFECMFTTM